MRVVSNVLVRVIHDLTCIYYESEVYINYGEVYSYVSEV